MKKIVSLLLCTALCVGLPFCFAAGNAYEESVAGLREVGYGTYKEEQTYDSDLCTLFSYSVLAPHGPYANLALVYKAGSPLGEGTVVSLPIPDGNFWGASSAPETLNWDPEGGQLTYSYYFDDPLHGADISYIRREAGTFLYTVDLHTGEVTEVLTPPTYEDILERHFPESFYAREQVLEAPGTTVLLLRQKAGDGGYSLHLVDRAETSDHRVRDLILPSTVILDAYPAWFPTDRAPDRLFLSEDGKTLTYVYSFSDKLASPYDGAILHEAGTYTYTVDISTGELEVEHTQAPLPAQSGKFSDVPAGSWFETGVTTCVEKGVMVGTGGDAFSPERELSQAECLTLAFRLYTLQHGGDETLETAPEDWGQLALTLADGTVFQGYGYQGGEGDPFGWWSWPKNDVRGGYARVPGEYSPDGAEQRAWMDAHPEAVASNAPASLTLNGETYQGTIWCWMPVGSYVLMFQPEEGMSGAVNDRIYHALTREAGPDKWWRNVSYTIVQRGLEDIFDPVEFSDHPATRGFFAQLIAAACEGHLDQINTVTAIPDLSRENDGTTADDYREAAYALYEAGILTGVDSAGTFAANATLTRAEAAVMVARALDETQRVSRDRSYHGIVGSLETEAGYEQETYFYSDASFRLPDNVTLILRYKPCAGNQSKRDYELWLIRREGDPQALRLSLPSTEVLSDGSAPTTQAPDSIQTVPDPSDPERKVTLTYTYRFPEPLWNGNTMLHDKGTYTYTVEIPTGEQSVVLEDAYEHALTEVIRVGGTWQLDERLETPLCTILIQHSEGGGGIYPGAHITLIFKDGSPNGVGEVVELPTKQDHSYGSILPHSISLNEEKTILTYVYQFDTDQYAHSVSGTHYLTYKAGTYTTTVDLLAGIVDEVFTPKE